MKLEEQIKEKFPFTNSEYIKEYVEVAENFAIGFIDWCRNNGRRELGGKTTIELLEIYKETL